MLPTDRADLLARVQGLLQQCRGPQAAIRMVDLFALATGDVIIPGKRYDQTRILRSLVEQLRRDGCPIGHVSGTGGGYFWADDPADLDLTIRWFHQRALSSLRQERALRRVPFAQVLEQHALDFDAQPDPINHEEP